MVSRIAWPWTWTVVVVACSLTAAAPQTQAPRSDVENRGPLAPHEALRAFRIEPGLAWDLVLSEPEIAQPVSVSFDERGRLWVVEYRQYPEPAGLKMLSRDGVWRVVYDGVPLPPPRGVRGADRISVHEDSDGDGQFDRHKVVIDGLNIATAIARGRGGLWVLNPPYLLFYPDANNDDVPDADPEVVLEGFGLEDTHSVVNSLRFGPDGWLYAAQGSTVSGRVKRPGAKDAPVHSMGQLLWRYHPARRKYEIFAEGGGNAFGVAFDAMGRVYSGHNGGDTRGFHYVQGGYYRKGFDKHGPLSNPYAFGYIDAMAHPSVPRFTHAFLVYEADALPERYRGKLLGVAPLLSHVVASERIAEGSTFRTRDVGHPVTSTDPWFRPVDIELGPEGAVHVADWYDGQVNHYRNHEGRIDRSNGRVYRLRAADARPIAPFDLGKATSDQLVDALSHPNPWYRDTARRLLGDRRDASVTPRLRRMLTRETGPLALEALWALHVVEGLDEATATPLSRHANPQVRLWAARLICDRDDVSPAFARSLAELARRETDPEARSQLACSARRLNAAYGLPIVAALLEHDEDADDRHIPLLLWWAIEARAASDREAVVDLFREPARWDRAIARKTIIERIMRRYAAAGTRADLETCATLLALAPGPEAVKRLVTGLEAGLTGRPLGALPPSLSEALARFEGAGGSVTLGLRQGEPNAIAEALRELDDPRGDRNRQLRYVEALGISAPAAALPALLRLATRASDGSLQAAALGALARYDAPSVGPAVVAALPAMTEDLRSEALGLLGTRGRWSRDLVEAARRGDLEPRSVPRTLVLRLQRHDDPALREHVSQLWPDVHPGTRAELQAEIARLTAIAREGTGDPRVGEKLFTKTCRTCHALFGQGGQVGPELTSFRRDDLDTLLLGIVNPSAEIREGHGAFQVATHDGRALTGLLIDQDPRVVVLRGTDGRDTIVPRDEIEAMKPSAVSLMPEGLLAEMKPEEVRDLLAYLRSSQPPK